MAISKNLVTSALQLQVEKGVNSQGDPILGKITYRNIKADATEQDLYDVAQVLGGLQQYTLAAIQRIDTNDLVEEI
ncbi:DUF1659 domain-containing protein [Peptococcaceae bacterium 1198_IL3148]